MVIDLGEIIRSEAFRRNPYPAYRQLREAGSAVWDEPSQTLELFGYVEVAAALRDPRLGAARSELFFAWMDPEQHADLAPLVAVQRDMMLFADPPRHTRLRGLVNRAFTPRIVERLRPRIQAIIDELLNPVARDGGMDVMAILAYPLPVMVILDLLGVPVSDRVRLKALSDAFAAFIGGQAGEPGVAEAANAGIIELNAYFREAIARRRVEPRADLISGLIATEERGDVLSEEEMIATCILVLFAGHETTTNLIGNGLLTLLRHPTERERIVADPGLSRTAIDELLRYDSPVQLTSRLVSEPMEIAGHHLEPGMFVDLWLGAANHDPAQFTNPDTLDLARMENRHLAFGYGIHFCVGAPLARLEGEVALTTLPRRFPTMALIDEPLAYHETLVFRALKRLPVCW